MRIGLVSTHTHPIALGLRTVSSCLKAAGHDVDVIFMSSRRDTAKADYSAALLDDFASRLRDVDLIGMSLMTNTFNRARVLVDTLRRADVRAPIVWGGTHPTVAPDESLEYADAICIGEGERAMLELVDRLDADRDPTDVRSFWFRRDGRLSGGTEVRNDLAPLWSDLDALPFADYELDTHWVADKEGLVRAHPSNLRGALDTLRVLTTRGCPYHCTFCNNTALREIHDGGGKWVRTRSLDNILAELRHALASFPQIARINFVDDLFFVRREDQIEDFAKRYNEEIGLPLELDAFPNTVTERKVAALSRVPIGLISMGIESASDDTLQNIYRRPTTKKRIADAIATFKRYRIRTEYHYIVSNPYEPDDNVIESMRFIADHHRGPSVLRVFPLMFYPGTPLYQRARQDGLISNRDAAAYDHMGTGALQFARHDYMGFWLRIVLNLRDKGLPRLLTHGVISFAASRPVRFVLDRHWFGPTIFAGYFVGRKIFKNLIYQPFVKPWGYLRRRKQAAAEAVARPWRLPKSDGLSTKSASDEMRCTIIEAQHAADAQRHAPTGPAVETRPEADRP